MRTSSKKCSPVTIELIDRSEVKHYKAAVLGVMQDVDPSICTVADIMELLKYHPDGLIVATIDDWVVGFLILDYWLPCEVSMVAVEKKSLGKGISAQLLAYAESVIIDRPAQMCAHVHATNLASLRMLLSAGYRLSGLDLEYYDNGVALKLLKDL